MSAVSSRGDDRPPNKSDPEALADASWGGLGGRPDESVEPTAALVAGIAKLRSPDLTTSNHESAARILRQLDELEARLCNRDPDGNDSLRTALAGLEAKLRISRRAPAGVEPPRQKTALQTGGESAAMRTPSLAGEMASHHASSSVGESIFVDTEKDGPSLGGELENACDNVGRDFGAQGIEGDGVLGAEPRQGVALETPVPGLTAGAQTMREFGECASSLEQFDRLARKFQRSLTQLDAAATYGASFEGHRAGNPVLEKFPAQGQDPTRNDTLTRHIKASHRQQAGQREAELAAGANEMNTTRDPLGDTVERMELARDSSQDQYAGAALELTIAKLAERLDRAGEGLASLASLEGSLGGLSVQLEETRRIVSDLSKAAESKPLNGPGSLEDAQAIMRGIAGLHALHEETARQAQLALTAIQESVKQVAGHCARLENAAGGMPEPRGVGASEDPFAPIFRHLAQHENPLAVEALADDRVQGPATANLAAQGDRAGDAGFLIEPGLGFPGRDEHREPRAAPPPKASQVRDEEASRTDFIAAARRAARTAQMELDGAASKSLAGNDGGAKPSLFTFGRSRGLFVTPRRPLVVGATVLFAAIGAYALARTLAHHNLNDFVPGLLKHTNGAAQDGKQAGVASRPFASMTTKGRPSASEARQNKVPGDRLSVAGAASSLTALLDPSRLGGPPEPEFPSGSTAPFGKPAPRAIVGSDAIVGGPMRPSNIARISAPPRPPAATVPARALPLAAVPLTVPSSGPLTAQAAPPAVGPNEDLLGQAEAGDAAAQFKLAVHYAEGGAGPRNYEQAAQWYEKAAQQGLAVAEYRLGSLYEKGLGVGKDIQRAKDFYQRAAEKGNTRAMHNLGVLAAEGGKPNYTSAALWFGKAAEYGIRDSQYNLAVLLARGLGLPKDLVKSYTWFAIVAATGDADAARKRDDVAARLTSSELAAANAAAAGFAPRRADHAANETLPTPAQSEAAQQLVKPKVSGL